MTALEPVRPRPRAFWGDARFLLGILLVIASVAGVWFVVAASRQTAPAFAANRTIVPGEAISGDDVRLVDVALGQVGDAYLPPDALAEGLVATRTIESGELVPQSAVGDAATVRTTSVVLRSAIDVPGSVRAGSVVEVWAAPLIERGSYDAPRILVADATVVSVAAGRLDDRRRLGGPRDRDPEGGRRGDARRDGRRVGAVGRAGLGGVAVRVIVAVDEPHGSDLAEGLEAEGLVVVAVVAASALVFAVSDDEIDAGNRRVRGSDDIAAALAEADAVVLEASRTTLSAAVVAVCDRRAVRIVPLAEGPGDERIAAMFGLEPPLPLGVDAWQLAERLSAPPARATGALAEADPADPVRPRVIAVWGPAGAPGRSTIAIELAVELARGGRHVGAGRCRLPRALDRPRARSRRRRPRVSLRRAGRPSAAGSTRAS